MEPRDHIVVKDIDLEVISVETYIFEVLEGIFSQITQVVLSHCSSDHLPVSSLFVLSLLSVGILVFLEVLKLLGFSALSPGDISNLSSGHSSVSFLLFLHLLELLLLKNLHTSMLKGFAAEHREDRLHINVETENEFVIFCQGLFVNSSLPWHEPWGLWPLDFDLSLATDLIARSLVSELFDELICLNVDILSSLKGLWGPHVSCKELLGGSSSGLGFGLCPLFAVVKELIRVTSGRNRAHCVV